LKKRRREKKRGYGCTKFSCANYKKEKLYTGKGRVSFFSYLPCRQGGERKKGSAFRSSFVGGGGRGGGVGSGEKRGERRFHTYAHVGEGGGEGGKKTPDIGVVSTEKISGKKETGCCQKEEEGKGKRLGRLVDHEGLREEKGHLVRERKGKGGKKRK